jgi:hypothetical protein
MNWMVCNQLGLAHAGPAPLSIMDGITINWNPTNPGSHAPASTIQEIPMPTRPASDSAEIAHGDAPLVAPAAHEAPSIDTYVVVDFPAQTQTSDKASDVHAEAPIEAPKAVESPAAALESAQASEEIPMPTNPSTLATVMAPTAEAPSATWADAPQAVASAPSEAPVAAESGKAAEDIPMPTNPSSEAVAKAPAEAGVEAPSAATAKAGRATMFITDDTL